MKLFLLLFLFFQFSFAENLKFYDLNGNEIDPVEQPRSIKEFMFKNFPNVKFYYTPNSINYNNVFVENGYILAVYYYGFSNKPLFILGKNPKKKHIDKALSFYSYDTFLKTYSFDYEFKNAIKEKKFILDDAYIHLGKPDSVNNSYEYTTLLYYNKLTLIFDKNYYLVNFTYIN